MDVFLEGFYFLLLFAYLSDLVEMKKSNNDNLGMIQNEQPF